MTTAQDWSLWSTSARLVVTRDAALATAREIVDGILAEVELACSRFRDDSEIRTLSPGPDGTVTVSPVLADLLAAALDAALRTDGAVDPTVGGTLADLGYDRDITMLDLTGERPVARVRRTPGWRVVGLTGRTLRLPAGVELDLGATAKAVAADRCAVAVADRLGCGVLVSLGGDIAAAGPAPVGGWQILVQDTPGDPAARIGLAAGTAVATSSSVRRTWRRGGATVHHVVDPRTSRPARTPWRTVSVVAGTCAEANAAATATLSRGNEGLTWLTAQGLPARLVDHDRRVRLLGGWPEEVAA
ncbi:MAG TPA: FAD:protein FMN transferase [Nocardioides sp.]|uniref:FAD:protein FMN transferase n=1 Tax=Nocardioides sp. TaxID=35761 RepID=UPI002C26ABFD|nr:FAD:protein FMN transferase [Nocardioides sp.]HQR26467.1 FAD:protein FMN transferase [Nocardioides sp.]